MIQPDTLTSQQQTETAIAEPPMPRRQVMAKLRSDRSTATGANQVWAMDWMHDELFDGRRIWVLTIIDTWSRLSGDARVPLGDRHGGHRGA